MNKKTNRSNLRAPTLKPTASIAPSATLAVDGDLPLSASNGLSAPEPLAAHDVLQAALAPRDNGDAATDAPAPDDAIDGAAPATAVDSVAADAATEAATDAPVAATPPAAAKSKGAKKPAKAADKEVVAEDAEPVNTPVKAAKVPKDKFVKVTFALPESEAGLLDALKKTHQGNGVALKKSQLLRAGLLALADLDSAHLAKLVAHLPPEPRASKKKK